LLRVFGTDFAACHQPERPYVLADAIFVHGDLAGLEIGDQVAVRIAYHYVQ
jgi:hypothetical protein